MTASGAAAFASSHRMVNRVHNNTADVRTFAEVTFLTGFTEFGIHLVDVADLTDHSTAINVDHTNFT